MVIHSNLDSEVKDLTIINLAGKPFESNLISYGVEAGNPTKGR